MAAEVGTSVGAATRPGSTATDPEVVTGEVVAGAVVAGDVVTGGPILVASLKLLGGEIAAKGVLAPEACFAPGPFFEDLRHEVNLFTERGGALVTEAFEYLD